MATSRIVFKDNEDGSIEVKVFHNPKVVYEEPKTAAQELCITVYNGLIAAQKQAEVNSAFKGDDNER